VGDNYLCSYCYWGLFVVKMVRKCSVCGKVTPFLTGFSDEGKVYCTKCWEGKNPKEHLKEEKKDMKEVKEKEEKKELSEEENKSIPNWVWIVMIALIALILFLGWIVNDSANQERISYNAKSFIEQCGLSLTVCDLSVSVLNEDRDCPKEFIECVYEYNSFFNGEED